MCYIFIEDVLIVKCLMMDKYWIIKYEGTFTVMMRYIISKYSLLYIKMYTSLASIIFSIQGTKVCSLVLPLACPPRTPWIQRTPPITSKMVQFHPMRIGLSFSFRISKEVLLNPPDKKYNHYHQSTQVYYN